MLLSLLAFPTPQSLSKCKLSGMALCCMTGLWRPLVANAVVMCRCDMQGPPHHAPSMQAACTKHRLLVSAQVVGLKRPMGSPRSATTLHSQGLWPSAMVCVLAVWVWVGVGVWGGQLQPHLLLAAAGPSRASLELPQLWPAQALQYQLHLQLVVPASICHAGQTSGCSAAVWLLQAGPVLAGPASAASMWLSLRRSANSSQKYVLG